MTLFEYLATAFSLVFSFSAMRLVAGLPHATRTESRYWVHVCLIAWQLLVVIGLFWTFWSYRDVDWNFASFGLALAIPCLFYFNACSLIPENPSSVVSWRKYFFSIRQRFFIGLGALSLIVFAVDVVALKLPLFHPIRAFEAISVAVLVVGAISSRHRVHAFIAVFFLILTLIVDFTLAFQPGSFARP